MTIKELLIQKGFIEGVDFSLDGEILIALESSEKQLPTMDQLKGEIVCLSCDLGDLLLVVLENKQDLLDPENDSVNMKLVLDGDSSGWGYSNIPCPSISELYELIDAAKGLKEQALVNETGLKYLADTDWKILRHIRQQALGIATSLTAEEYLALEHERQMASESILK